MAHIGSVGTRGFQWEFLCHICLVNTQTESNMLDRLGNTSCPFFVNHPRSFHLGSAMQCLILLFFSLCFPVPHMNPSSNSLDVRACFVLQCLVPRELAADAADVGRPDGVSRCGSPAGEKTTPPSSVCVFGRVERVAGWPVIYSLKVFHS